MWDVTGDVPQIGLLICVAVSGLTLAVVQRFCPLV